MLDDEGEELTSVGITTGKADVFDTGQDSLTAVPVNPGGMPIYRGGKVIGGVGIAGVRPNFAEYAATAAAAGAGRGLDFSEPLGAPGAVFIDGLRLPFFGACTNITCIRNTLRGRPPGSAPGLVSNGTFVIQPRDGLQAPEGYILGPRGSAVAGGLSADEVRRIVDRSVDVALRTRAMIRLPINQPARMTIGISDETGVILALYRMADGTVFSSDVAMTKARNAYYFRTREGYDVLREIAANSTEDRYTWSPEPPAGKASWRSERHRCSCERAVDQRDVRHRAREGSGVIQSSTERDDALGRNLPSPGFQSDDPTERGGDPDRAPGVGADRRE